MCVCVQMYCYVIFSSNVLATRLEGFADPRGRVFRGRERKRRRVRKIKSGNPFAVRNAFLHGTNGTIKQKTDLSADCLFFVRQNIGSFPYPRAENSCSESIHDRRESIC